MSASGNKPECLSVARAVGVWSFLAAAYVCEASAQRLLPHAVPFPRGQGLPVSLEPAPAIAKTCPEEPQLVCTCTSVCSCVYVSVYVCVHTCAVDTLRD